MYYTANGDSQLLLKSADKSSIDFTQSKRLLGFYMRTLLSHGTESQGWLSQDHAVSQVLTGFSSCLCCENPIKNRSAKYAIIYSLLWLRKLNATAARAPATMWWLLPNLPSCSQGEGFSGPLCPVWGSFPVKSSKKESVKLRSTKVQMTLLLLWVKCIINIGGKKTGKSIYFYMYIHVWDQWGIPATWSTNLLQNGASLDEGYKAQVNKINFER